MVVMVMGAIQAHGRQYWTTLFNSRAGRMERNHPLRRKWIPRELLGVFSFSLFISSFIPFPNSLSISPNSLLRVATVFLPICYFSSLRVPPPPPAALFIIV